MENQTLYLYCSINCSESIKIVQFIINSHLEDLFRIVEIEKVKRIPSEIKYVPTICYVNERTRKITKIVPPKYTIPFLKKLYSQYAYSQKQPSQYQQQQNKAPSQEDVERGIINNIAQPIQFSKRVGTAKATTFNNSCPVINLISKKGNGIVDVYSMKDPNGKVIGNSSIYNSKHPLRSSKSIN